MMSNVRYLRWRGNTVHCSHDEADLSGVCGACEMGIYLEISLCIKRQGGGVLV